MSMVRAHVNERVLQLVDLGSQLTCRVVRWCSGLTSKRILTSTLLREDSWVSYI